MSVVMKSFERLVLSHLRDIKGPLLDPLQFTYRSNRSVDDAVNMGLQYIYCTTSNDTVSTVDSFRFLGTTISQVLKWCPTFSLS